MELQLSSSAVGLSVAVFALSVSFCKSFPQLSAAFRESLLIALSILLISKLINSRAFLAEAFSKLLDIERDSRSFLKASVQHHVETAQQT